MWLIWTWRGSVLLLFRFRSFIYTVRLSFHCLLERVEGWGSWKLDSFHGSHMCIYPNGFYQWMVFTSEWFLPVNGFYQWMVFTSEWFLPVNGFYRLTIFLKKPIIDASYGLKYSLRKIISLERFGLVKTNFTKSVFDPSKPPPPILRKKS